MNFIHLLKFYSRYEVALFATGIFILYFLITSITYYSTRDRKVLYLGLSSLITTNISFIIFTYIGQEWLDLSVTKTIQVGLWLTNIVSLFNLLVIYSKYISEITSKYFDIDHITRSHFRSTLNTTVLTIVALGVPVSLLEYEIRVVLGISILAILDSIWANHIYARYFLND